MRHILILALALAVMGCGSGTPSRTPPVTRSPAVSPLAAGESVTIRTEDGVRPNVARMPDGRPYCIDWGGMDGRLVYDPVVGTKIVMEAFQFDGPDDPDTVTLVVAWPLGYIAQRVGDEVEVLDPDRNVVTVTGRDVTLRGDLIAPEEAQWDGWWPDMPEGTYYWYCGPITESPPQPDF